LSAAANLRHEAASEQQVSILIPTLNEAENIDLLLTRLFAVVDPEGPVAEIVFADGGSTDGTQDRVARWAGDHAVRLVQCDSHRGLSGDVLQAAEAASGQVVVVMDADLSHPPEAIPSLVAPLLDGTHDMAVGSRYVPGGGTPDWPWTRRLSSRVATALAWPLVSVRDPMSGFFAVRRDHLLELGQTAAGFKIGLTVLSQGDDALRVKEVPIVFHDRTVGRSKFGLREIGTYLAQLLALAGASVPGGSGGALLTVGLIALAVDLAVFNLLLTLGLGRAAAHLAAFAAATLPCVPAARGAFGGPAGGEGPARPPGGRFLGVWLLAAVLRGVVLEAFVDALRWSPRAAILPAAAAGMAVGLVGGMFFVFPAAADGARPATRWRVFALCMAGYGLLLRLALAGATDLLPEEAYYWLYGQHLDIGYLDHPPMVAWMIRLSTWIGGNSEFFVRLPALLCWVVMAGFLYRLATNMFDRTVGLCTVFFVSVLPVYFGMGMVTLPDASLFAAWAACLYFFERALLGERRHAWWGVGVCFGLGMLSKYTMGLLGPAALVFVLVDRPSRRWLLRPGPYVAAFVAALVFSPVIVWNGMHEWASFAFQGPRRWSGHARFSVHFLLGAMLGQVTPLALIGVPAAFLGSRASGDGQGAPAPSMGGRHRLFALVFSVVPLSVFVLHSLQDEPKFNWTAPVWLAALPLFASCVVAGRTRRPVRPWVATAGFRLWKPASVVLLIFYGIAMYHLVLGLPGVPALRTMSMPVGWEELSAEVAAIDRRVQAETGRLPLIVGLEKYSLSSQLVFYDPSGSRRGRVSSRHLLGRSGLMWEYWQPVEDAVGKTALLVGFRRSHVEGPRVEARFARLGEVEEIDVRKAGRTVTHIYCRVGYDYSAGAVRMTPRPRPTEAGPSAVGLRSRRTRARHRMP